jgi:hypothetical protein
MTGAANTAGRPAIDASLTRGDVPFPPELGAFVTGAGSLASARRLP